MKNNNSINRRHWLRLGLGLTAGSATGFTLLSPPEEVIKCETTPAMELGPFPPMKTRTQPDHDIDLTHVNGQTGVAKGEIIEVVGKIMDENCTPVEKAIVELWQANHHGKYNHEYDEQGTHDPNFQGWGQAITLKDGSYKFKTIIPGLYGTRTRHIHFKISRRGYHEMVTQLYFEGEERNKTDRIYNDLTHEEQKIVTRVIERSENLGRITFDMNIRKVRAGTVSGKVLAAYTGSYKLLYKGTGLEQLVTRLYGDIGEFLIDVTREEEQLFIKMPMTPKMEVTWKSKDQFDASEFYNMTLNFKRGNDEKINALALQWEGGDAFVAERMQV